MKKDFRFGLEAEYLLADAQTYRPLWYQDVTFEKLDRIMESVSLTGLPTLTGLSPEPPHKKLMPFVVEGYGVTDENFNVINALPKGVEIRTPICSSIEETIDVFETCYKRLKEKLIAENLLPIALSHHPIADKFFGPQNKRRHDFWLWAMEVMTTYGPDINVSFPEKISQDIFSNLADIHQKINYYAPSLAAISLASPFLKGNLWNIKNTLGQSYRGFKRSIVAPAIEVHADENFRIEFKLFEMSNSSLDFKNYFLLVLALFLDSNLKERSSDQERIYDLGQISIYGLDTPFVRERLGEILFNAPRVLNKYGFDSKSLNDVIDRVEKRITPALMMQEAFLKHQDLKKIIQERSWLKTLNNTMI
jgi:hypothetical protein